MNEAARTLHVLISGRVQGVGFRYWTRQEAEARGLDGWVRNRRDGRVEAVFQGAPAAVEAMLAACRDGPTFARVADLETVEAPALSERGFRALPTV